MTGSVAAQIAEKIREHIAPEHLEIIDDSHRHVGHAGARPEGETHFTLLAVSDKFLGLSRIDRHRLVHDALREELAARVHALAIRAYTPEEYARLARAAL
ncbi:MAG: BolA family transcriptional regulator [Alphaproteobacteria bacterium]|nr:BolA family transcriptional regulator [Alphaproteobacteria bacterium]